MELDRPVALDKMMMCNQSIYELRMKIVDNQKELSETTEKLNTLKLVVVGIVQREEDELDKGDKSLSTQPKRDARMAEIIRDDDTANELRQRKSDLIAETDGYKAEVEYLKREYRVYEIAAGGGNRGGDY